MRIEQRRRIYGMLDRGENAGMCLVESENLTEMYPEKICDTWTVLDVKNHIERQGYHFFS